MSFSGHGSMVLECPYCSKDYTARGLYWHLVIDEGLERDYAYDVVGDCISEQIFEVAQEKYRTDLDKICGR